jgi:hypothetical protein
MIPAILFESLSELKEKMLTFCLLRMNIDWMKFSDIDLGSNIIHLLVKFKKIGTLIQILKVMVFLFRFYQVQISYFLLTLIYYLFFRNFLKSVRKNHHYLEIS